MPKATEVQRTDSGQFQPGQSGNPLGRPKGSRNQITLLKESLELQLREQAVPDLPGVLNKCVELALDGDRAMIKLLLELHMSKGLSEVRAGQEKVTINIKGPSQEVIDVTPVPADKEVDYPPPSAENEGTVNTGD